MITPQVIELHCVAHRLELAILDAGKATPFIDVFERAVKSVYAFYHRSPKRLQNLEAIVDVLEGKSRHPGGILLFVRLLAS